MEIENIPKLGTKTNKHAIRIMPHPIPDNGFSHTIYTIICSDSCLPNHVRKPDPQYQNFYKHCINYSTLCLSKTTQFPQKIQGAVQLSRSSSRLLTSCCLHQITDCPMHPVWWGHKPQTSPLLHTRYLHFTSTIAASTAQSGFS